MQPNNVSSFIASDLLEAETTTPAHTGPFVLPEVHGAVDALVEPLITAARDAVPTVSLESLFTPSEVQQLMELRPNGFQFVSGCRGFSASPQSESGD